MDNKPTTKQLNVTNLLHKKKNSELINDSESSLSIWVVIVEISFWNQKETAKRKR